MIILFFMELVLEVNSDFRIQVMNVKLIFSKLKVKKKSLGEVANIFFNENLSFISKLMLC